MAAILDELWTSAAAGASGFGKRAKESGVLGSAWSGLKAVFGLHVKNIARLDPEGFGEQQKVRVPVMMSQLVDRGQPCEFLPRGCFTKRRNIRLERGQLIVGGKAFPAEPVKDNTGFERAVTCDNRLLYALNTNHQKEALSALGLDASKYKNKRLVVECEGSKVIPPSPERGAVEVMRAVYNAEVTAETRRVINQKTGSTSWPATSLVMPFNVCASALNFALMVPQGVCHVCARLLGMLASYMENEARHRALAKSNGTLESPYYQYYICVSCGFVLRIAKSTASIGESLFRGARRASVGTLKSVPIFANSIYNADASQFRVGWQLLKDSITPAFGRLAVDLKEDIRDASSSMGFYRDAIGEQVQDSLQRYGRPGGKGASKVNESYSGSSRQLRAAGGHETGSQPVVLNKSDMLKVIGAGRDLAGSGLTVSYGTRAQLRDNFIPAESLGANASR
ncbi:hypothetical protein [Anaplasma capra]|uniref:hypothetical protein n=1 Tax=Anaplasma capra TaxID=1562740 RepID=UPI0021D5E703|nr:hypothetical protein [Anaplasma capra]MCU7611355.1 hypothetical protein [Anaplasma capra]MCU7612429.1 hypothetical protein [Anaplasma capra]